MNLYGSCAAWGWAFEIFQHLGVAGSKVGGCVDASASLDVSGSRNDDASKVCSRLLSTLNASMYNQTNKKGEPWYTNKELDEKVQKAQEAGARALEKVDKAIKQLQGKDLIANKDWWSHVSLVEKEMPEECIALGDLHVNMPYLDALKTAVGTELKKMDYFNEHIRPIAVSMGFS